MTTRKGHSGLPLSGSSRRDGAREMLAAAIESVARAGKCYLRLSAAEGETIHAAGEPPEGDHLNEIALETAGGASLRLEGGLETDQLEAVAKLLRQTVETYRELTETRDDLGRSREELSLLLDFSHAVCRLNTISEVVDRFLADVVSVLKAREGTFLALDEEGRELRVLCHHGSTPSTVRNFKLRVGEGIAGKVVEEGWPRIVNDVTHDPNYVEGVNPIRSLIAVPMRVGDRVIGVVCINDRKDGKPFEGSHLRLLSSLARLGQIGLENARLYEQVRDLLFESVDGLVGMMEARHPGSVGHSRRVARLGYSLGRQLGLDASELERIYLAALIHDLGAAPPAPEWPSVEWSLPEFERPGPDGAWLHPAGILKSAGRLREALPGLTDHREWWDGSGHPARLAGGEISLQGRIIAVAHAFDVMTSSPDFQEHRQPPRALEALREQSGVRFDPEVVKAFEQVYEVLRLESWVPPDDEETSWSSAPDPPKPP